MNERFRADSVHGKVPDCQWSQSDRRLSRLPTSLRMPERVWRPSAARKALGFTPLVKAGRAHASRVEGIPLIAASAKPFVLFAGRPAA
jgi:hypothetical protein